MFTEQKNIGFKKKISLSTLVKCLNAISIKVVVVTFFPHTEK